MPELQGPVSKRQLGPVSHEGKWLLLRKSDFLIQFLQFLHAAKGNPVNDRLIHAHHQSRRNHKLAVFVIDPVHYLSHGMGFGGKHLQLLALMGDEVIDTDR
jgi:hypothetical protein